MNPKTKAIDSCRYLYLQEIGEPSDNALHLVIAEAVSANTISAEALSEHAPELRAMLADSKEIVHKSGCQIFELNWPSYIAYAIRNESYALPEAKDSVGNGELFVEYTKSRYLDSLALSTFASCDYPGPFKHWAIHCLNHVIDIASTEDPIIIIRIKNNVERTCSNHSPDVTK